MSQNSSESSRMLVTAGVETAQKLDNDRNPLLIACRAGSLKDVQLLVEHGADLGTRTPDGLTCLFVSIKNKHIGVVSYLLEQESCPVDDIDEDGCTLLHHVVLLNDPDATSKLIKKGVDINAQNQVQLILTFASEWSWLGWRNSSVPCNKAQSSSILKSAVEVWSGSQRQYHCKNRFICFFWQS